MLSNIKVVFRLELEQSLFMTISESVILDHNRAAAQWHVQDFKQGGAKPKFKPRPQNVDHAPR
jgi:hypothetical protein